jgi:hypothetical protein
MRTHSHQVDSHRPAVCDETRSTRLHYQLRCLLPRGHHGDHRWTPELLPLDLSR